MVKVSRPPVIERNESQPNRRACPEKPLLSGDEGEGWRQRKKPTSQKVFILSARGVWGACNVPPVGVWGLAPHEKAKDASEPGRLPRWAPLSSQ